MSYIGILVVVIFNPNLALIVLFPESKFLPLGCYVRRSPSMKWQLALLLGAYC